MKEKNVREAPMWIYKNWENAFFALPLSFFATIILAFLYQHLNVVDNLDTILAIWEVQISRFSLTMVNNKAIPVIWGV